MSWLLLILLFVLILAVASIGSASRRAGREERLRQQAAANFERVQREMPDSRFAKMGPNEFFDEYQRFLRGRALKVVLVALAGMTVIPSIVLFSLKWLGFGEDIVVTAALVSMPMCVFAYVFYTGGFQPRWPVKSR